MGSLYNGAAAFWGSIQTLVTGDDVTQDSLYRLGMNRLQDEVRWLVADNVNDRANLASTALGTTAKYTGSVDLATLVYDPTSGTLNGLTFQIASDNSGTKTVTFGTGAGVAPTGPGDVVTQINTASGGNPLASVDSAGHLTVASTTTGAGGTINVVGGSAVAPLGFAVGAGAPGAATGGDGSSVVGVAAYTGASFNLPAGTLRTILKYAADNAITLATLASQVTTSSGARLVGDEAHTGINGQGNYAAQTLFALLGKIWDEKAGLAATNAWTGANSMSGNGGTLAYRTSQSINAALTTQNIDSTHDHWFSTTPLPAGNVLTITVKHTGTVPPDGFRMRFTATTLGINAVHIVREDATELVKSTGGTFFGVDMVYVVALTAWKLLMYSGDGTLVVTAP